MLDFVLNWSAFVGSGETAETKHGMPFNTKITRHAPKHSDKYFEETNEVLISLCEKLNETFNQ